MENKELENKIVIYKSKDGQTKLDVKLENETVWLNRQQLATLFDRDVKTIGKHIANALKEELSDVPATVAKFATVQKEGDREVKRQIEYYNLDIIISVGYRVKSKRGVEFRRWANSVLKDYLIKGYAINQRIREENYRQMVHSHIPHLSCVAAIGRHLQKDNKERKNGYTITF